MEQKKIKYKDGVYSANIDITMSEWKEMLTNPDIFTENSLNVIGYWYSQADYMATSKEIMEKFNIERKRTPFNGIVISLGKRIINYLNRFKVIGTDGNKAYFVIPFEGWYENYDVNKNFVWKIRAELIQTIEELHLFNDVAERVDDDYKNIGII